MMQTRETLRDLLSLGGRALFVLGFVWAICMPLFGLWPTFLPLVMLVAGAGIVFFLNESFGPWRMPAMPNVRFQQGWSQERLAQFFRRMYRPLVQALRIAAFTLACVFVLLMAARIFGQNYFNNRDTMRESAAISAGLEQYRSAGLAYPATLDALIGNNPLRADWQKDEWGTGYRYAANAGGYSLTSAGQDLRFGTADDLVARR